MGPGQTTPGKSNSTTSVSTGNETQRRRDRQRGNRERDSLHFTAKAFVSSEYFTETRKTMRNRGFRVSVSPEIKDERWRKEKK